MRGRGRYLDDIELPQMLHAAFVRSPFAHARLLTIDAKQAEAHPGTVRVFSGADLEDEILPLTVSADPAAGDGSIFVARCVPTFAMGWT